MLVSKGDDAALRRRYAAGIVHERRNSSLHLMQSHQGVPLRRVKLRLFVVVLLLLLDRGANFPDSLYRDSTPGRALHRDPARRANGETATAGFRHCTAGSPRSLNGYHLSAVGRISDADGCRTGGK